MYDFIDNIKPYIIVSFGAISGAICRIKITNILKLRRINSIQSIFIVNIIAIFLLSFFIGLKDNHESIDSYTSLYLLVSVGFLGSFSTFSGLVSELHIFFLKSKWLDLISYSIISIISGILFASLGYRLANV